MRVLVFEPQFLGHNLAHAARVVRELASLPCEVVLATSRQAAESQEFAVQFSGLDGFYSTKVIDSFRLDTDGRSVRTTGLSVQEPRTRRYAKHWLTRSRNMSSCPTAMCSRELPFFPRVCRDD